MIWIHCTFTKLFLLLYNYNSIKNTGSDDIWQNPTQEGRWGGQRMPPPPSPLTPMHTTIWRYFDGMARRAPSGHFVRDRPWHADGKGGEGGGARLLAAHIVATSPVMLASRVPATYSGHINKMKMFWTQWECTADFCPSLQQQSLRNLSPCS